MSMQTITIPELMDVVTYVAIGQREPIMLWSPPGQGKSESVAQACRQHSGVLCDVRLSQYDSVDLRGIPVPTDGATVWHAPITLPFNGVPNPEFNEAKAAGKPIFLFLDEINSAAPSVAAVAYQLINDRAVGEHQLMDNVIVIAAGNREQDRGVTNRMPTPLANRFTHYEIGLDVDAWCYWAQSAGLPPEGVAFMQFRKPLLSTFDPAKPDKAFATPRSWKKALSYFADPKMPEHIKQASMAGAVGEGPAAEFWGFVDVWGKMPKMSDIIAKPDKIDIPDEAAMRYAVSVACSGAMDHKTSGPINTYMMRMDPEFAVLCWQLAVKRDMTLAGVPEYIQFSKKFRQLWV